MHITLVDKRDPFAEFMIPRVCTLDQQEDYNVELEASSIIMLISCP